MDCERAPSRGSILLGARGDRKTAARDLWAELGITQSSSYTAVGSKSARLDAVIDRYLSAVEESLLLPLRQSPDGCSALKTFFRDINSWIATDGRGCLMVNLMADEAPTNPAVAERTKAHRDQVRASLRVAVERTCPTEGTDVVDHRTSLLLATTFGLNIAARACATPTELDRMVAGVAAEIGSWTPAGPTPTSLLLVLWPVRRDITAVPIVRTRARQHRRPGLEPAGGHARRHRRHPGEAIPLPLRDPPDRRNPRAREPLRPSGRRVPPTGRARARRARTRPGPPSGRAGSRGRGGSKGRSRRASPRDRRCASPGRGSPAWAAPRRATCCSS